MRKPAFCICENKDADQLRSNREADQRLCFRYTYSAIPLLPKPLAIICGCTARFVSDLVGNPEDRFSHNEAHFIMIIQAPVGTLSGSTIPVKTGGTDGGFCSHFSVLIPEHHSYFRQDIILICRFQDTTHISEMICRCC